MANVNSDQMWLVYTLKKKCMFKNKIWEQPWIKIHEAEEFPSFLLGHFPVWVVYPSAKGQPKKNQEQKQNVNRTECKLNMLSPCKPSLPGINLGSRRGTSTAKRKRKWEAAGPGPFQAWNGPFSILGTELGWCGATAWPGRQLRLLFTVTGTRDIGCLLRASYTYWSNCFCYCYADS